MNPLVLCPKSSILVLCLLADIVVLKNGNEIQGEILKETGSRVVLQFPGGTLKLERRDIASIQRQSRFRYLVEQGEKQLRRDNPAEARTSFQEALREDPDSSRARCGLLEARKRVAASLQGLGRYEEARSAYREVLELDPANDDAAARILAIDRTVENAREEEERGRRELASGKLEKGIWRLGLVYERFPARRKALGRVLGTAIIKQGDRHLERREWAAAEREYLRALTLEPKLSPLLENQFILAKQRQIGPLLTAGDFDAVETQVEQGLEVSPTSEVLRYYRGLCLEVREKKRQAAIEYLALLDRKRPPDLEDAVTELRLAVEEKLASQGKVAPTANPRSNEVARGDFRKLKSRHFVVLHKNPSVARDAAFVAERSYSALFHDLHCITHLRNPLQIVVFPTREEYSEASGMAAWSGGSHTVARKRGPLSDHRIYSYQNQPRLMSGVLPHEIAHALLAHRLNYPDMVPLWANEGFAISREPSYVHQHYRRIVARGLARKTLIPLEQLVRQTRYPDGKVRLFYAQSCSLVEFLLSLKDLSVFVEFLRKASQSSNDLGTMLRRYYKIAGVRALENRWIAWFERENSR